MGSLSSMRDKALAQGEITDRNPDVDAIPEMPPERSEAVISGEAFIAEVVRSEGVLSENAAALTPKTKAVEAVPAQEAAAGPEDSVEPPRNLLSSLEQAIKRLGPDRDAASVLASEASQDAWGEIRGLSTGANALGLGEEVEQVFRKFGRPGQGLLAGVKANVSLPVALAGFRPGSPAAAPLPTPDQATRALADAGSRSGGGMGLGSAFAKLVAAPVTLPMAAGSRVWQFLSQRFGSRPAIKVSADEFAVIRNQFDDAANRAIDKISHVRSGPMNPILTEMVADPLKTDEQFYRMKNDTDGEYRERGERLKEALSDPAVRRQYEELDELLDGLQYRGRRLAEAGHEGGVPVEDIISDRLGQVTESAKGIPALDHEGKLAQLREALESFVERIKEFVRALFQRSSPTM